MNLELTGKLIEKGEIQQVKDTFRKREFVLELPDETGNGYINFAKMQLVQAKCEIIDRFNMGDNLRVNFNIKGNRVERDGKTSYFSNLDAWRIERADAQQANNGGGYQNQGQAQGYNNAGNGGGNWNQGNNNGGGYQNQGQNQGANNSGNGGGNWNNNNPAPAYQNTGGNNNVEQADDLPF